MKINADVGFSLVETPAGYQVQFDGMSRPATNEEVILWSALRDNEDTKRNKFNEMLDSFQAVINNDERVGEAFNTCRGQAIFALTVEVSRYRRQVVDLQSKLTSALEYIRYVAQVINLLDINELKDDETETTYRVLSDDSLNILKDIASKSTVKQEELDFPLHQQLSDLRNKVAIAERIARNIKELANADCSTFLIDMDQ